MKPPSYWLHLCITPPGYSQDMSEYGSRLLLRRICLSRELRIRTEHRLNRLTGQDCWTIRAVDQAEAQAWTIEDNTLDRAARALARLVGVALPSDQLNTPDDPPWRRIGRFQV